MILTLAGLVYGIGLLLAANRDLGAREGSWRSALLSLGLTQVDMFWDAFDRLIRPLSPGHRPAFDKGNPIHRAAGLLALAQVAWCFLQTLAERGGNQAPSSPPEIGGALLTLAASAAIYVLISALGTGWITRRDLKTVLARLGLRAPKLRDVRAGLVIGLALYGGMLVAGSALEIAAADEAGALPLFDAFKGVLPAALLLAILAATGEEILYRGALQPVCGLGLSSLLFTLWHWHYGLSAEMLILFFVSLGFGFARLRFSTSAAIIAHATYNFAPFLALRLLPA